MSDPIGYEAVLEAWNSICAGVLAKAETLNEPRRKVIRARWRDLGGLDGILALFQRVRASPFLTGQTDEPFFATFDWVMGPKNFPKVLDGNYDDRAGKVGGHGRGRASPRRYTDTQLRYFESNPDRDPRPLEERCAS